MKDKYNLSVREAHARYWARKRGKLEPIVYMPLDQALEAALGPEIPKKDRG